MLTYIVKAGLTTWIVSTTIARSKLFESVRQLTNRWPMLYELLTCQYCIAHWVAIGVILLLTFYPTGGNLVTEWGTVAGIACLTGKVLEVLK